MLLNGKIYYGRILGAPHENKFNPGIDQWSFDLSLNPSEVQVLLDAGVPKDKIKNKNDERGDFVSFSRDATKRDGSPGKPYDVVDGQQNPWPQDVLIGNGSEVNVKTALNEREFRGKKFLKPSAIEVQVWELVEYKGGKDAFPVRATASAPVSPSSTESW